MDTEGKTKGEILAGVTPAVRGAYAVRILRSGDVEVMVKDQVAKDAALNAPQVEGVTILRQDYPVAIHGVPLTIEIAGGKHADNRRLAGSICEGSKSMTTKLQINKMRWLHAGNEQAKRKAKGKPRGTVIICLPTKAMQEETVRKGIVIESEHFEAAYHDYGTEIRQCFKCSGWGHTQAACGKPARCGTCAGAHDTRGCSSSTISCANCGKGHRAWQREQCRVFKSFLDGTQEKRMRLASATMGTRQHQDSPFNPTRGSQPATQGWTTVGNARKRPRQRSASRDPSPSGEPSRLPPGRPSGLRKAGADPRQSRLPTMVGLSPRMPSMTPGTQGRFTSTPRPGTASQQQLDSQLWASVEPADSQMSGGMPDGEW